MCGARAGGGGGESVPGAVATGCPAGWRSRDQMTDGPDKPVGVEQDQEAASPEISIAPVVGPGYTFASVTDKISSIVLTRRPPRGWIIGFAVSFLIVMLLLYAIS